MSQDKKAFLAKLQAEAALQSKLQQKKWLPEELDVVTNFIGRYPWQVLVVMSGVVSLLLELLKVWL